MSGRYPRVGTDSSVYAQNAGLKPSLRDGLGHQLDNTLAAGDQPAASKVFKSATRASVGLP